MKTGMNNGVIIHLLPLNELVKDKMSSSNIKAGFILMSGEMKTRDSDGNDMQECEVTFTMEDVTKGDIKIIFCHPESLLSERGAAILTQLIRKNLLICVVPDEYHKTLHWGLKADEDETKGRKEKEAFRSEMIDVLKQIKARAPSVPFLLETATLMKKEVLMTKELLMIDPIIIYTSPVMVQHKFINIKRPDQSAGFFGKKAKGNKPRKEGLLDYLRPLVIEPLQKTLALPKEDRNVMIVFCRDKDTLALIDQVRNWVKICK
jgi:hypothetical protein